MDIRPPLARAFQMTLTSVTVVDINADYGVP